MTTPADTVITPVRTIAPTRSPVTGNVCSADPSLTTWTALAATTFTALAGTAAARGAAARAAVLIGPER